MAVEQQFVEVDNCTGALVAPLDMELGTYGQKTLFIVRKNQAKRVQFRGYRKGRELRQHIKWAMGLCKIQVSKNSRTN